MGVSLFGRPAGGQVGAPYVFSSCFRIQLIDHGKIIDAWAKVILLYHRMPGKLPGNPYSSSGVDDNAGERNG